MKYHECTDVDDVKPWCFTDLRKGEWGYCQKSCLGCQTEDGDECVFPFTYQDTKYNECTSVDDVKPWCFTDLRSGEWGYCMGSCSTTSSTPARKTKPTHSSCQTENGDACVFPFTYQGTLYHECTSVVAGKPWCFTDGGGWGYCQESCSTKIQPTGNLQVRPSQPGDDKDYCQLGSDHTMCQYKAAACNTIGRGLNDDERRAILDEHNEFRRKIASQAHDSSQPAASNMKKLIR